MFFLLSKIGWYLVQPLVVVLGIGVLGAILTLARLPRLGTGMVLLSLVLLAVVALSPLGLLMLARLENRFPQPALPAEVTGIVVLGGSFDTRVARTRGVPELNDAADRITTAMALARRYPDARVLFSGGSAGVFAEDMRESDVAREVFGALGLDPARLELEERSRNTAENAAFSREIAAPGEGETWLLVTSAAHMPRAVGCFRVAGFPVLPYPTDYQTPGGDAVWQPSSATVRNVEKVHFAIREYLGLLAYRLSGRTDALFPAP